MADLDGVTRSPGGVIADLRRMIADLRRMIADLRRLIADLRRLIGDLRQGDRRSSAVTAPLRRERRVPWYTARP
jgi:hypothetical protein